ncbi:MFS transporter [Vibrio eleionomae]|nr:MFS transporter [Vibrio eleionomae]
MNNQTTPFSFISAALSLMATYFTAATAIPLYGVYQTEDHISYLGLSLSSVVYFLGAVIALVLLGRLSNFLGRKVVSITALLLAALSLLFFINLHSTYQLIGGRLLQGLSCGLATTALAAWVADHAKSVPSWVAPAVISCGPMTGLTFGGLGSGVIFDAGVLPRQLPFLIAFIILVVCLLMSIRAQETIHKRPGAISSLKPNFRLPQTARQAFPIAACTFICTWALGGFFQAFGPAMAREQLHSNSAIAAACVFAAIMAPSSIGASIASKMSASKAQRYGMLLFTLCVIAILFSLHQGSLLPFLIASVLAGITQGLVLSGSIQTMIQGLLAEERANVLSVIYTTSYIGAAVPTYIAGRFSQHYHLLQVACGYGVLALFGSITVLITWYRTKKPKTQVMT